MQAASFDLTIEQGATFRQVFRWQTKTKQPFDLTGFTAKLAMRSSVTSLVALKTLTTDDGSITLGGTDGTITLYISPTDTGRIHWPEAVYDMVLYAPNGDVYRLLEGQVVVSAAVTR